MSTVYFLLGIFSTLGSLPHFHLFFYGVNMDIVIRENKFFLYQKNLLIEIYLQDIVNVEFFKHNIIINSKNDTVFVDKESMKKQDFKLFENIIKSNLLTSADHFEYAFGLELDFILSILVDIADFVDGELPEMDLTGLKNNLSINHPNDLNWRNYSIQGNKGEIFFQIALKELNPEPIVRLFIKSSVNLKAVIDESISSL